MQDGSITSGVSMTTDHSIIAHADAIQQQIKALPDDVDADQIEQTANRLKRFCYEPLLTRIPEDFLHITKGHLLSFIDDLVEAQDKHPVSEQDLNLLLHQYRFLQNLRRDNPETWDEISEVWEDD
jgi:hypothetical protein